MTKTIKLSGGPHNSTRIDIDIRDPKKPQFIITSEETPSLRTLSYYRVEGDEGKFLYTDKPHRRQFKANRMPAVS